LTWLCTKASRTFSGTKPPDILRNLLRNQSFQTFTGTFSGTFSGTLLNVTWLCTKASQTFSGTLLNVTSAPKPPNLNLLRNLVECTSAHRSYSGLKTALAYAFGETKSN